MKKRLHYFIYRGLLFFLLTVFIVRSAKAQHIRLGGEKNEC